MGKKKPVIIIKLNQLEASVLDKLLMENADIIEYAAEQELRPLTSMEDLNIDVLSNMHTQIMTQTDKIDIEEVSKMWDKYDKEYKEDQEGRAKLN